MGGGTYSYYWESYWVANYVTSACVPVNCPIGQASYGISIYLSISEWSDNQCTLCNNGYYATSSSAQLCTGITTGYGINSVTPSYVAVACPAGTYQPYRCPAMFIVILAIITLLIT